MSTESKKILFHKEECSFLSVLRERVHLYFKENQISPKANGFMYFKSIFLMSLVAITFLTLLCGFGGATGVIVLYAVLGFVISITTMNIAHDALHGAYHSGSASNRMLGFLMDLF